MLGNFSFGDYFKNEAVDYAWEFVTGVMGLEPGRLWATVHEGDPVLSLDEDEVAIAAWKSGRHSAGAHRAARARTTSGRRPRQAPAASARRSSTTAGERYACGDPGCGPGHCDRYMEIYNLVFMEYDLRPGNVLERLPAQNVDTGLGLERTMCVVQEVDSVFDTDGFRVIMDWIAEESGVAYRDSEVSQRAHRVLADHARAATFLIAEGVLPSNEGRGYICRRLLRRAIQQGQRIGLDRLYRLPAVVIEQMSDAYPALAEQASEIERVVREEEARFTETLERGLKELDALAGADAIGADDAFRLAATFGFPIELTAGARRGARPAGRRRRLPRADGGAPRDLARRRREERSAARRGSSPARPVSRARSSATPRRTCSRRSARSSSSRTGRSSASCASRRSTRRAVARSPTPAS